MSQPLPSTSVIRRRIYDCYALDELAEVATRAPSIRGASHCAPVQEKVRRKLEARLPHLLHATAAEAVREWEAMTGGGIVQVKFPAGVGGIGSGNTWTYRCPGAKVGDWIVIPPTPHCQTEQFVPVVALGRSGWNGPVKDARMPQRPMPAQFGGCEGERRVD